MKKTWILAVLLCLVGCTQTISRDLVSTKPVLDTVEDVSIIIASDLHYFTESLYSRENETFMKMVRYSDGKMMHYSEEIIDAFIDTVIEETPDVLILSGDLTFNGEKLSHEALAQKLKRVNDAGIKVMVIPGNHDFGQYTGYDYSSSKTEYYRTDNTTPAEFASIYKDFGYSDYASMDQTSLSYRVVLNDAYQLLFIDVNGNEHENVISDNTLEWIEAQLIAITQDQSQAIIISHQNLVEHTDLFQEGFTIENNDALLSLFEIYNVRLGFSGHLHIQDIAQENTFYDVASGALSVLDHRYGTIRLKHDGSITYETVPLKVDLPEDSREFFNTISYWKAFEALERYEYDQSTKDAMIELCIDINEHYFRGDLYLYAQAYKATEAYQRWTHLKYNFFGSYIQSVIESATEDENVLELPPNQKTQ